MILIDSFSSKSWKYEPYTLRNSELAYFVLYIPSITQHVHTRFEWKAFITSPRYSLSIVSEKQETQYWWLLQEGIANWSGYLYSISQEEHFLCSLTTVMSTSAWLFAKNLTRVYAKLTYPWLIDSSKSLIITLLIQKKL